MTTHATIAEVHETSARSDAAYATPVDMSSVADRDDLPCQWYLTPGVLVSLLDMLRFDPRDLHVLLKRIIQTCYDMSVRIENGKKSNPPQNLVIEPAQGKEVEKSIIEPLARHCQELGLDSAQDQIDRIKTFLAKGGPCSYCVRLFDDLHSRILGQLRRRLFFHIPLSKVPYYEDVSLFGANVSIRFSDAIEDIAEAGKCFATGRYTACVFHLMRVMERAVQSFARKLGIPERFIHSKEWGRILSQMKKKIDDLPQKTPYTKKKKEAYSESWAFLDRVREAWRNPTMHPKETYTEEEAKDIFAAVKAFMTRLAELI